MLGLKHKKSLGKIFKIIAIVLLVFLVLIMVFLVFLYSRPGSIPYSHPKLPDDPCSSYRSVGSDSKELEGIKSGIKCCDEYKGSQKGFTLSEIKDECYWRRLYYNYCDISSQAINRKFEIKSEEEANNIINFYKKEICDKLSTKDQQDRCYERIGRNECLSHDVKDCDENDNFCMAILGGDEKHCFDIKSVPDRYWCLTSMMKLYKVYEPKMCDGIVYDPDWSNVYGWSEEKMDSLRDSCYLTVSKKTDSLDLCKSIQGRHLKNKCLLSYVKNSETTDLTICDSLIYDEIANEKLYNYDISFREDLALCYAKIGMRLDNKEVCNRADFSGAKERCIELFYYSRQE